MVGREGKGKGGRLREYTREALNLPTEVHALVYDDFSWWNAFS